MYWKDKNMSTHLSISKGKFILLIVLPVLLTFYNYDLVFSYDEARVQAYLSQSKYDEAIKYLKDSLSAGHKDNNLYYALGNIYRRQQKINEAIKWYKELIKIDPLDVRGYYGLGNVYNDMDNFAEATRLFEEAVKVAPGGSYGYRGLGLVNADAGNYAEAIKYYKEAIRLDPRDSSIYVDIGNVYANMSDYSEALRWIREAARMEPDRSYIYANMGRVYENMGSYDEAIKRYEESLRVNVYNSESYLGLGNVYSKQRKYDKAIKMYKEAIRIEPYVPESYYGLGIIYRKQRNYSEAIKCYKEAIRINPTYSNIYVYIGDVYGEQGNYSEAMRWYKESIKKIPPNRFFCPYEGLGLVYRKLGKASQAEENFLTMVKRQPFNYESYYNLARYYYQVGKIDKAIYNVEKALSFHSIVEDKARILRLKGFILLIQENYAAAEVIFNNLIKDYGANSSSLIGMGHISNAKKEYKSAKKYFEDALKLAQSNTEDEDRTMAMLGLGWVSANEGRYQDAIGWYKKILKGEPLQILALTSMGNAYIGLGEYDAAERYFKLGLDIDRDNEYILAGLGMVYLNKGYDKSSEELLFRSLKVNNASYSCPYEGLGLLYLKQGKLKDAEDNFRKAIEINPDIEYKKYTGLAKIYIKYGKYREAERLLEKSIRNYPYDAEAKALLKEVKDRILRTDKVTR